MKEANLKKLTEAYSLIAKKTRTGQSLLLEEAKKLIGEILATEPPEKSPEPKTIEDEIYEG